MESYEKLLMQLKEPSQSIDYDKQFAEIKGKIYAAGRRARIRNASVAVLMLVAVYGWIYSPYKYFNMPSTKDSYAERSLLSDDTGNDSSLSEYLFTE